MTFHDPRDPRDPLNQDKMQVDPMFRSTSASWGWGIAIAAVLFIFVVLLFATDRSGNNVAETPSATPPATTGSAPKAPPPQQRSTTGQAPSPSGAPPAKQ